MDGKPCIAVIAVAVVAIGGCGSSKPLSRAELVQKANAICKQREAKIAAVVSRSRNIKAAEQRLLPTISDAAAKLRALKPPESLRAQYTRYVADDAVWVSGIRRALAGRGSNPQEAARGHDSYRLTQQLGLSDCKS